MLPDTPASRLARRRRRERALDALPVRSGPSRAFVPGHVPGTFDQVEVVRSMASAVPLSRPESEKAERFFAHVLNSSGREGDGFVPVPAKLIEREFRGLDWRAFVEAGALWVKPFDRVAGRSREFAVPLPLRIEYFEAGPTTERVARDGLYDVMTGRPTRRRVKSDRRTASGNALPPLVRAAIDAVGEVPVDAVRIERDHLPALRAATETAAPGEERVTAEGRFLNDLRCFQAVLTQGARPLDPEDPGGLWLYRPAYRPQRFGRVSQVGGGLQSCSTAMKAVAYPPTFPPSLWSSS